MVYIKVFLRKIELLVYYERISYGKKRARALINRQ